MEKHNRDPDWTPLSRPQPSKKTRSSRIKKKEITGNLQQQIQGDNSKKTIAGPTSTNGVSDIVKEVQPNVDVELPLNRHESEDSLQLDLKNTKPETLKPSMNSEYLLRTEESVLQTIIGPSSTSGVSDIVEEVQPKMDVELSIKTHGSEDSLQLELKNTKPETLEPNMDLNYLLRTKEPFLQTTVGPPSTDGVSDIVEEVQPKMDVELPIKTHESEDSLQLELKNTKPETLQPNMDLNYLLRTKEPFLQTIVGPPSTNGVSDIVEAVQQKMDVELPIKKHEFEDNLQLELKNTKPETLKPSMDSDYLLRTEEPFLQTIDGPSSTSGVLNIVEEVQPKMDVVLPLKRHESEDSLQLELKTTKPETLQPNVDSDCLLTIEEPFLQTIAGPTSTNGVSDIVKEVQPNVDVELPLNRHKLEDSLQLDLKNTKPETLKPSMNSDYLLRTEESFLQTIIGPSSTSGVSDIVEEVQPKMDVELSIKTHGSEDSLQLELKNTNPETLEPNMDLNYLLRTKEPFLQTIVGPPSTDGVSDIVEEVQPKMDVELPIKTHESEDSLQLKLKTTKPETLEPNMDLNYLLRTKEPFLQTIVGPPSTNGVSDIVEAVQQKMDVELPIKKHVFGDNLQLELKNTKPETLKPSMDSDYLLRTEEPFLQTIDGPSSTSGVLDMVEEVQPKMDVVLPLKRHESEDSLQLELKTTKPETLQPNVDSDCLLTIDEPFLQSIDGPSSTSGVLDIVEEVQPKMDVVLPLKRHESEDSLQLELKTTKPETLQPNVDSDCLLRTEESFLQTIIGPSSTSGVSDIVEEVQPKMDVELSIKTHGSEDSLQLELKNTKPETLEPNMDLNYLLRTKEPFLQTIVGPPSTDGVSDIVEEVQPKMGVELPIKTHESEDSLQLKLKTTKPETLEPNMDLNYLLRTKEPFLQTIVGPPSTNGVSDIVEAVQQNMDVELPIKKHEFGDNLQLELKNTKPETLKPSMDSDYLLRTEEPFLQTTDGPSSTSGVFDMVEEVQPKMDVVLPLKRHESEDSLQLELKTTKPETLQPNVDSDCLLTIDEPFLQSIDGPSSTSGVLDIVEEVQPKMDVVLPLKRHESEDGLQLELKTTKPETLQPNVDSDCLLRTEESFLQTIVEPSSTSGVSEIVEEVQPKMDVELPIKTHESEDSLQLELKNTKPETLEPNMDLNYLLRTKEPFLQTIVGPPSTSGVSDIVDEVQRKMDVELPIKTHESEDSLQLKLKNTKPETLEPNMDLNYLLRTKEPFLQTIVGPPSTNGVSDIVEAVQQKMDVELPIKKHEFEDNLQLELKNTKPETLKPSMDSDYLLRTEEPFLQTIVGPTSTNGVSEIVREDQPKVDVQQPLNRHELEDNLQLDPKNTNPETLKPIMDSGYLLKTEEPFLQAIVGPTSRTNGVCDIVEEVQPKMDVELPIKTHESEDSLQLELKNTKPETLEPNMGLNYLLRTKEPFLQTIVGPSSTSGVSDIVEEVQPKMDVELPIKTHESEDSLQLELKNTKPETLKPNVDSDCLLRIEEPFLQTIVGPSSTNGVLDTVEEVQPKMDVELPLKRRESEDSLQLELKTTKPETLQPNVDSDCLLRIEEPFLQTTVGPPSTNGVSEIVGEDQPKVDVQQPLNRHELEDNLQLDPKNANPETLKPSMDSDYLLKTEEPFLQTIVGPTSTNGVSDGVEEVQPKMDVELPRKRRESEDSLQLDLKNVKPETLKPNIDSDCLLRTEEPFLQTTVGPTSTNGVLDVVEEVQPKMDVELPLKRHESEDSLQLELKNRKSETLKPSMDSDYLLRTEEPFCQTIVRSTSTSGVSDIFEEVQPKVDVELPLNKQELEDSLQLDLKNRKSDTLRPNMNSHYLLRTEEPFLQTIVGPTSTNGVLDTEVQLKVQVELPLKRPESEDCHQLDLENTKPEPLKPSRDSDCLLRTEESFFQGDNNFRNSKMDELDSERTPVSCVQSLKRTRSSRIKKKKIDKNIAENSRQQMQSNTSEKGENNIGNSKMGKQEWTPVSCAQSPTRTRSSRIKQREIRKNSEQQIPGKASDKGETNIGNSKTPVSHAQSSSRTRSSRIKKKKIEKNDADNSQQQIQGGTSKKGGTNNGNSEMGEHDPEWAPVSFAQSSKSKRTRPSRVKKKELEKNSQKQIQGDTSKGGTHSDPDAEWTPVSRAQSSYRTRSSSIKKKEIKENSQQQGDITEKTTFGHTTTIGVSNAVEENQSQMNIGLPISIASLSRHESEDRLQGATNIRISRKRKHNGDQEWTLLTCSQSSKRIRSSRIKKKKKIELNVAEYSQQKIQEDTSKKTTVGSTTTISNVIKENRPEMNVGLPMSTPSLNSHESEDHLQVNLETTEPETLKPTMDSDYLLKTGLPIVQVTRNGETSILNSKIGEHDPEWTPISCAQSSKRVRSSRIKKKKRARTTRIKKKKKREMKESEKSHQQQIKDDTIEKTTLPTTTNGVSNKIKENLPEMYVGLPMSTPSLNSHESENHLQVNLETTKPETLKPSKDSDYLLNTKQPILQGESSIVNSKVGKNDPEWTPVSCSQSSKRTKSPRIKKKKMEKNDAENSQQQIQEDTIEKGPSSTLKSKMGELDPEWTPVSCSQSSNRTKSSRIKKKKIQKNDIGKGDTIEKPTVRPTTNGVSNIIQENLPEVNKGLSMSLSSHESEDHLQVNVENTKSETPKPSMDSDCLLKTIQPILQGENDPDWRPVTSYAQSSMRAKSARIKMKKIKMNNPENNQQQQIQEGAIEKLMQTSVGPTTTTNGVSMKENLPEMNLGLRMSTPLLSSHESEDHLQVNLENTKPGTLKSSMDSDCLLKTEQPILQGENDPDWRPVTSYAQSSMRAKSARIKMKKIKMNNPENNQQQQIQEGAIEKLMQTSVGPTTTTNGVSMKENLPEMNLGLRMSTPLLSSHESEDHLQVNLENTKPETLKSSMDSDCLLKTEQPILQGENDPDWRPVTSYAQSSMRAKSARIKMKKIKMNNPENNQQQQIQEGAIEKLMQTSVGPTTTTNGVSMKENLPEMNLGLRMSTPLLSSHESEDHLQVNLENTKPETLKSSMDSDCLLKTEQPILQGENDPDWRPVTSYAQSPKRAKSARIKMKKIKMNNPENNQQQQIQEDAIEKLMQTSVGPTTTTNGVSMKENLPEMNLGLRMSTPLLSSHESEDHLQVNLENTKPETLKSSMDSDCLLKTEQPILQGENDPDWRPVTSYAQSSKRAKSARIKMKKIKMNNPENNQQQQIQEDAIEKLMQTSVGPTTTTNGVSMKENLPEMNLGLRMSTPLLSSHESEDHLQVNLENTKPETLKSSMDSDCLLKTEQPILQGENDPDWRPVTSYAQSSKRAKSARIKMKKIKMNNPENNQQQQIQEDAIEKLMQTSVGPTTTTNGVSMKENLPEMNLGLRMSTPLLSSHESEDHLQVNLENTKPETLKSSMDSDCLLKTEQPILQGETSILKSKMGEHDPDWRPVSSYAQSSKRAKSPRIKKKKIKMNDPENNQQQQIPEDTIEKLMQTSVGPTTTTNGVSIKENLPEMNVGLPMSTPSLSTHESADHLQVNLENTKPETLKSSMDSDCLLKTEQPILQGETSILKSKMGEHDPDWTPVSSYAQSSKRAKSLRIKMKKIKMNDPENNQQQQIQVYTIEKLMQTSVGPTTTTNGVSIKENLPEMNVGLRMSTPLLSSHESEDHLQVNLENTKPETLKSSMDSDCLLKTEQPILQTTAGATTTNGVSNRINENLPEMNADLILSTPSLSSHESEDRLQGDTSIVNYQMGEHDPEWTPVSCARSSKRESSRIKKKKREKSDAKNSQPQIQEDTIEQTTVGLATSNGVSNIIKENQPEVNVGLPMSTPSLNSYESEDHLRVSQEYTMPETLKPSMDSDYLLKTKQPILQGETSILNSEMGENDPEWTLVSCAQSSKRARSSKIKMKKTEKSDAEDSQQKIQEDIVEQVETSIVNSKICKHDPEWTPVSCAQSSKRRKSSRIKKKIEMNHTENSQQQQLQEDPIEKITVGPTTTNGVSNRINENLPEMNADLLLSTPSLSSHESEDHLQGETSIVNSKTGEHDPEWTSVSCAQSSKRRRSSRIKEKKTEKNDAENSQQQIQEDSIEQTPVGPTTTNCGSNIIEENLPEMNVCLPMSTPSLNSHESEDPLRVSQENTKSETLKPSMDPDCLLKNKEPILQGETNVRNSRKRKHNGDPDWMPSTFPQSSKRTMSRIKKKEIERNVAGKSQQPIQGDAREKTIVEPTTTSGVSNAVEENLPEMNVGLPIIRSPNNQESEDHLQLNLENTKPETLKPSVDSDCLLKTKEHFLKVPTPKHPRNGESNIRHYQIDKHDPEWSRAQSSKRTRSARIEKKKIEKNEAEKSQQQIQGDTSEKGETNIRNSKMGKHDPERTPVSRAQSSKRIGSSRIKEKKTKKNSQQQSQVDTNEKGENNIGNSKMGLPYPELRPVSRAQSSKRSSRIRKKKKKKNSQQKIRGHSEKTIVEPTTTSGVSNVIEENLPEINVGLPIIRSPNNQESEDHLQVNLENTKPETLKPSHLDSGHLLKTKEPFLQGEKNSRNAKMDEHDQEWSPPSRAQSSKRKSSSRLKKKEMEKNQAENRQQQEQGDTKKIFVGPITINGVSNSAEDVLPEMNVGLAMSTPHMDLDYLLKPREPLLLGEPNIRNPNIGQNDPEPTPISSSQSSKGTRSSRIRKKEINKHSQQQIPSDTSEKTIVEPTTTSGVSNVIEENLPEINVGLPIIRSPNNQESEDHLQVNLENTKPETLKPSHLDSGHLLKTKEPFLQGEKNSRNAKMDEHDQEWSPPSRAQSSKRKSSSRLKKKEMEKNQAENRQQQEQGDTKKIFVGPITINGVSNSAEDVLPEMNVGLAMSTPYMDSDYLLKPKEPLLQGETNIGNPKIGQNDPEPTPISSSQSSKRTRSSRIGKKEINKHSQQQIPGDTSEKGESNITSSKMDENDPEWTPFSCPQSWKRARSYRTKKKKIVKSIAENSQQQIQGDTSNKAIVEPTNIVDEALLEMNLGLPISTPSLNRLESEDRLQSETNAGNSKTGEYNQEWTLDSHAQSSKRTRSSSVKEEEMNKTSQQQIPGETDKKAIVEPTNIVDEALLEMNLGLPISTPSLNRLESEDRLQSETNAGNSKTGEYNQEWTLDSHAQSSKRTRSSSVKEEEMNKTSQQQIPGETDKKAIVEPTNIVDEALLEMNLGLPISTPSLNRLESEDRLQSETNAGNSKTGEYNQEWTLDSHAQSSERTRSSSVKEEEMNKTSQQQIPGETDKKITVGPTTTNGVSNIVEEFLPEMTVGLPMSTPSLNSRESEDQLQVNLGNTIPENLKPSMDLDYLLKTKDPFLQGKTNAGNSKTGELDPEWTLDSHAQSSERTRSSSIKEEDLKKTSQQQIPGETDKKTAVGPTTTNGVSSIVEEALPEMTVGLPKSTPSLNRHEAEDHLQVNMGSTIPETLKPSMDFDYLLKTKDPFLQTTGGPTNTSGVSNVVEDVLPEMIVALSMPTPSLDRHESDNQPQVNLKNTEPETLKPGTEYLQKPEEPFLQVARAYPHPTSINCGRPRVPGMEPLLETLKQANTIEIQNGRLSGVQGRRRGQGRPALGKSKSRRKNVAENSQQQIHGGTSEKTIVGRTTTNGILNIVGEVLPKTDVGGGPMSTPSLKRHGSENQLKVNLKNTKPKTPKQSWNLGQLLKTKEPFLQYAPCHRIDPFRQQFYCRECPLEEESPVNACRFVEFRYLQYCPDASSTIPKLRVLRFSEPFKDPLQTDLDVWIPLKSNTENPFRNIDRYYLCKRILSLVENEFCNLLNQEKEVEKLHLSKGGEAFLKHKYWKRVNRVREMCDVCQTTLFNSHWTCGHCGFAVCVDCYEAREKKITIPPDQAIAGKDEYSWFHCHRGGPHFHKRLLFTQIIPGDCLIQTDAEYHKVRSKSSNICIPGSDERFQSSLRNELMSRCRKNASDENCDKNRLETLDRVIATVIELTGNKDANKTSASLAQQTNVSRFVPLNNGKDSPLIDWLCNDRLLWLKNSGDQYTTLKAFQGQWEKGKPVIISGVTEKLNPSLWRPEAFSYELGDDKTDLVDCSTGITIPLQPMKKFWAGFYDVSKRLLDGSGNPMILKLKDWPPGDDFETVLPRRFNDLMQALPLPDYTHRSGYLNLVSWLPNCFLRPDLGPKMYTAYGSAAHPNAGTTNLHLDVSDAVNVLVYVGLPIDVNYETCKEEVLKVIDEAGCDPVTKRRVEEGLLPGALWHIYEAKDTEKIRHLLNKVAKERGEELGPHDDPIHDQNFYLHKALRERLFEEYGVEGYTILQCLGDAVFIPAGAPHQVLNLQNCIKVAEDFVSPENITQCLKLTQEFRALSDKHHNHEDKLQVKNIIYHAVKGALGILSGPAEFNEN